MTGWEQHKFISFLLSNSKLSKNGNEIMLTNYSYPIYKDRTQYRTQNQNVYHAKHKDSKRILLKYRSNSFVNRSHNFFFIQTKSQKL